jgi:beta-lactam-binding protein with PASTA domain
MSIKEFFYKFPLVKHLLLMLGVSIVIFICIYFFLKVYGRHGEEFSVPEIVGKNIEELNTFPQASQLNFIVIDSIFVPNSNGGIILSQDPIAHQKVKAGRKIYLTISSYRPEKIHVPDIVDMTVRRAISELEGAGLEGGKLTFVESEFKNAVLEQYYKGRLVSENTKVEKGSQIDLTIGKGNSEEGATTVAPFVLGKSPKDARKSILSSSLNVGKEHYPKDVDPRYVRVAKQSPNYNGRTRLHFGTEIEIWYESENTTDFSKLVKDFKVDTTTVEDEVFEDESESFFSW